MPRPPHCCRRQGLAIVAATLAVGCAQTDSSDGCVDPVGGDLDLGVLAYSNLGGTGPSTGQLKAIRYSNVTQVDNEAVDLVIEPRSQCEPYDAQRNSNVGDCRQIGNINILGGVGAVLAFRFVSNSTDSLTALGHFHLTFFLVDGRGALLVPDSDSYCLSNDTMLLRGTDADGAGLRFAMASPENSTCNVSNPSNLSLQARTRAVTFHFKERAQVFVRLASVKGAEDGGIDFAFTGASPLESSGFAVCNASSAATTTLMVGQSMAEMINEQTWAMLGATNNSRSVKGVNSTNGSSATATNATNSSIAMDNDSTVCTNDTNCSEVASSVKNGSTSIDFDGSPWAIDATSSSTSSTSTATGATTATTATGTTTTATDTTTTATNTSTTTTTTTSTAATSTTTSSATNTTTTSGTDTATTTTSASTATTAAHRTTTTTTDAGGNATSGTTTATMASAEVSEEEDIFDCHEDWPEVWNSGKKFWCCKFRSLGCSWQPAQQTLANGATTFDCAPGQWSQEETAWCCKHKPRTCSNSTADADSEPHKDTARDAAPELMYLRVEQAKPEALGFTEVAAFAANGSLIRPVHAAMGSVDNASIASRCVDGLQNTSCQTSGEAGKNWLLFGYPQDAEIASIALTGHHGNGGGIVKIAADAAGLNATWISRLAGAHEEYRFMDITSGMVFVRVTMTKAEALLLKEVEAFASDGSSIKATEATMGSVEGSLVAARCVDGILSTVCQTSSDIDQNWFMAAYPSQPAIAALTVTGRDAGAQSVIDGAIIQLTTDKTGLNVLWSSTMVGAHGKYHFADVVKPLVHVRVDMTAPGSLSLLEEEAFAADGTKIAAVSAEMGSTHGDAVASRCVDGSMTTSCETASTLGNNWLLVTYPASPEISALTFTRSSGGNQSGVEGAVVKVATDEAAQNEVWSTVLVGNQEVFHFSDIARRRVYVRIEMMRRAPLCLSEVEALAQDGSRLHALSARMGSTSGLSMAQKCIDGSVTTSCRTANLSGQSWLAIAYPLKPGPASLRVTSLCGDDAGKGSADGATIKLATDESGLSSLWSNTLSGARNEYRFDDLTMALIYVRVDLRIPSASLMLSEVEAFSASGDKVSPLSARMGSTSGAMVASRCIDGSIATACQTDNATGRAWLAVAFPASPEIASITLARGDAFVQGAAVSLVTDEPGLGVAWTGTLIGVHDEYHFDVVKQLVYVRIEMTRPGPLCLGEVETFAANGAQISAYSAKMGSTNSSLVASRCIDGVPATQCRTGNTSGQAWLTVALPSTPLVTSIRLTRPGNALPISGASIKMCVDEGGRNVMWSGAVEGERDEYLFTGITRSLVYVRVDMDASESLALAEVEAFAADGSKVVPISAEAGSVFGSRDASSCVDGSLSTACRSSSTDVPHWLIVSFAAQPAIDSILLSRLGNATGAWTDGATVKVAKDMAGLNVVWSSSLAEGRQAFHFSGIAARQSTTATSTSAVANSQEPFDCSAGTVGHWSLQQQDWCCLHHDLGCSRSTTAVAAATAITAATATTAATAASTTAAATAPTAMDAATDAATATAVSTATAAAAATTTSSEPFECNTKSVVWQGLWSDARQHWCCVHYGRGCSTKRSTTTEPFDCEVGLSHWTSGWSYAKQDWCCQVHNQGCRDSEHNTLAAALEIYDCFAGFSEEWSCAKRLSCCARHNQGCDLAARCGASYDCTEPSNEEGKWAWCCTHEGLGCDKESVVVSDRVDGQAQWQGKFELVKPGTATLRTLMLPSLAGSIALALVAVWAMRTCAWPVAAVSARHASVPMSLPRHLGYSLVSVEEPD